MTRLQMMFRGMFYPRSRVVLVILVLAFNTAGMLFFMVFSAGIDLSLEREASLLGADLLVLPAGAEFDPQEVLAVGIPGGVYMDDGLLDALAQEPAIAEFTPQLYFRSLNMGCCSMRDYPLVGIDPVTDFIVRPLAGGGEGDFLGEYGLVAGCGASRQAVKKKTIFFGQIFDVKHRLPCTGMAADMTFYIPIDTARKIAGDKLEMGEGAISSIAVRLADRDKMDYVVELIKYLGEDVKVLKVPEMIRSASERIRLVEKLMGMSLAALGAAGTGILAMVIWMAAGVKMKEAALLRALGATPREVAGLAAGEILLLGVTGSLIGTGAGLIFIYFFKVYGIGNAGAPFVLPEFGVIVIIAAIAVGISMVVTFVVSLIVSGFVSGIEPEAALKNTR